MQLLPLQLLLIILYKFEGEVLQYSYEFRIIRTKIGKGKESGRRKTNKQKINKTKQNKNQINKKCHPKRRKKWIISLL